MKLIMSIANFKSDLREAMSKNVFFLTAALQEEMECTLLTPCAIESQQADLIRNRRSYGTPEQYASRIRVFKNIARLAKQLAQPDMHADIHHFQLGNLLELFLLRVMLPAKRNGLRIATISQPYLGVAESLQLSTGRHRGRGIAHHRLFNAWWHLPLYMFGATAFDRLIVSTEFQRRQLWFIDSSRISIIPYGIADPGPLQRPPLGHPLRILYLGHATPVKGIGLLLQALSAIRDTVPFQLTLAISDFGSRQALLDQLHASGLQDRVAFPKQVDVTAIMRAHDLAVLPLRSSVGTTCFPNVALEAMACGLPLIACATEVLAELIRHGETGFLTPVDDAPALSRLLLELLSHPERLQEISIRQRAAYVRRFTLEKYTHAHRHMYEELLQTDRPPASSFVSNNATKERERTMTDKRDYYIDPNVVAGYNKRRFYGPGGQHVNEIELAAILQPLLPLSRQARILDLPVGTGRLAAALLAEGFTQIEGGDFSPSMLEEAARLCQGRIATSRQDIFATTWDDNSFDAVVCLRFTFHTDRLDDLLRELTRILKPGGVLLFDTICWTPRTIPGPWRSLLGGRLWSHPESRVKQLLPRHGLRLLSMRRELLLPSYVYRFLPSWMLHAVNGLEKRLPSQLRTKAFWCIRKGDAPTVSVTTTQE
ncbi:MAG: glycosyltransferase [Magnetococcales bacterium]|nr:glycosyltransferase [Magnetococcales bacterium]